MLLPGHLDSQEECIYVTWVPTSGSLLWENIIILPVDTSFQDRLPNKDMHLHAYKLSLVIMGVGMFFTDWSLQPVGISEVVLV